MNDETIRGMLRSADAGGTGTRVEGAAVRRSVRRRRAGRGVAAALLASLALWPLLHRPAAPLVAPGPSVVRAPADDDVTQRIAAETAILLARRRATGAYLDHDPAFVRDRAAQTLFVAAQEAKSKEAVRAYATAAQLFPESSWSARAAALAQVQ